MEAIQSLSLLVASFHISFGSGLELWLCETETGLLLMNKKEFAEEIGQNAPTDLHTHTHCVCVLGNEQST